jgi:hypothetical protein
VLVPEKGGSAAGHLWGFPHAAGCPRPPRATAAAVPTASHIVTSGVVHGDRAHRRNLPRTGPAREWDFVQGDPLRACRDQSTTTRTLDNAGLHTPRPLSPQPTMPRPVLPGRRGSNPQGDFSPVDPKSTAFANFAAPPF